MDDKFYVKKIIRDDNMHFEFDGHEIYLAAENTLLSRPEIETTDINYTETDGGEMIHQKLPPPAQDFAGLIVPRDSDYWTLYSRLTAFFQINHYYKIVYVRRDGKLFARHNAWMANNLQLSPNAREDHSPFTVGFKVQNSLLYEYAEDGDGNEIFANTVILPLLSSATGGEVWDEIGEVWDNVGGEWEFGGGGVQSVNVDSITKIYPFWTVKGLSINPILQNNTTDTVAKYDGTVAVGQTLRVDFATGEAWLDTAKVSRNVSGQVSFAPNMNIAGFNHDGGTTENSEIAWNNVIGG